MSTSEFYLACRNGDIDTVKRLLPSLTLHDINRMEPNGSTALHAASYYNHFDIVKLLLEAGAVRSIINMYNMTPADEAATSAIKLLFRRSPEEAKGRFVAADHSVEWQKHAAGCAVKIAAHNLAYCKPFENMITAYERITQAIELRDSQDISQIKYFLDKARETNDVSYLLRAYTAETDFYRRLNVRSAQLNATRGHPDPNLYLKEWSLTYNAQLLKDPTFQKFHWTGKTYRGMDTYIKQLTQIEYYLEQASSCNENGLARLYYMSAKESIQKLSIDIDKRMLKLESEGKQPKEICRR
ncbi:unnamed protein product [Rotaria sp. Silwood1]|nr:unnamed protein product [Rotaria sp. Silwood1]